MGSTILLVLLGFVAGLAARMVGAILAGMYEKLLTPKETNEQAE